MLEVDLYLIAYLDHAFVTATEADQGAFEDLLEEADPVLLAWLTGAEEPESSVQKNIVLEIQQARKDHRHFT